MKQVTVQVRSKSVEGYTIFAVISPRGGARLVDTDMLTMDDLDIVKALAVGSQAGSADLTIPQLQRIAELGTEIDGAVAAPIAPAPVAAPVEAQVERPGVRKLESIVQAVMEPRIEGDGLAYDEVEVEKHAWMCEGCGLVWGIAWHAETCGSRGHVAKWAQMYSSGPVINGVPSNQRFYDRVALRREPVA